MDQNIAFRVLLFIRFDLKFQYNTLVGKLNQCAKFQKVAQSSSLSSTLHVPSKRCMLLYTPLCENGPKYCISRTSISSIDLTFQYNTSVGKLNQCTKFQKVSQCSSLSSTLHVPSKRCYYTLCENGPKYCISRTSVYSIDLKFQYNTSVDILKPMCKASESFSMSKFVFNITCTIKTLLLHPVRKWTKILHFANFYLFD